MIGGLKVGAAILARLQSLIGTIRGRLLARGSLRLRALSGSVALMIGRSL